jgi:uncharacterized protein
MIKNLKSGGLIITYISVYAFISQLTILFRNKSEGFHFISKGNFLNYCLPLTIAGLLIVIIFPIMIFFLKKENIFKLAKIKTIKPADLLLTLITGLSIGFISICLFNLTFMKEYQAFGSYLSSVYQSNSLQVFICYAITAAFSSELVFRGLVFNEMKKIMNNGTAIVINAVISGIVLSNFEPYLACFGVFTNLIFTMIYFHTDSLTGPITAQISGYFCSYLLIRFGSDVFIPGNSVSMTVLIVISFILVSLCVYCIWKNNRMKINPHLSQTII